MTWCSVSLILYKMTCQIFHLRTYIIAWIYIASSGADPKMQMGTSRISGRTYSCDGLSFLYGLPLAYKKLRTMHVNGADATAMIDHNIIPR